MTCQESLWKDREEGPTRRVKTQALWDVGYGAFLLLKAFEKAATINNVTMYQLPTSL